MRLPALVLVLAALAGCSAGVEVDRAVIDTRTGTITLDGNTPPGTFFPPGQAKKGRC